MRGRQADVRYSTGVPQLWVAVTRRFGPVCVVNGATGEIHLNSTSDEGVPDEIDHGHLYGLIRSPMKLVEVLEQVAGAPTARRVGTDAITPVAHGLGLGFDPPVLSPTSRVPRPRSVSKPEWCSR